MNHSFRFIGSPDRIRLSTEAKGYRYGTRGYVGSLRWESLCLDNLNEHVIAARFFPIKGYCQYDQCPSVTVLILSSDPCLGKQTSALSNQSPYRASYRTHLSPHIEPADIFINKPYLEVVPNSACIAVTWIQPHLIATQRGGETRYNLLQPLCPNS